MAYPKDEEAMPHLQGKIALPPMTPGTRRNIAFHRFGAAGARPKAYLQAAIHANELPGAMALHHLMPMLVAADRARRIKGEIIVVPTVNPIGLAQVVGNNHLGRYELLGRENFNRNWHDLAPAVAERVAKALGRDPAANVAAIRRAALASLAALRPQNELQALRAAVMKLSADADVVLDLHCDQQAALHLFISRKDWPGAAQALAADIGAEATLYNDPYPEALTFSGVHSGLWARLAARFPAAAIPQACLSATDRVSRAAGRQSSVRRGRREEPVPLSRAPRDHRGPGRSPAAPQGAGHADRGHGRRLLPEAGDPRIPRA